MSIPDSDHLLSDRIYSDACSRPAETEFKTSDPVDQHVDIELVTEQFSLLSQGTTTNSPHHTPIFRIPFEITAEIFELHTEVNSTPFDYPQQSRSKKFAPFLLTAVCRTWREIALTTPRLWTTVNIFISSLAQIPLLAELTGDCMRRSGQLPLTISITNGSLKIVGLDVPRQQEVSALFDVIRCYSSRWYRLILCIPAHLYADFMGVLKLAPLLEDLRINPTDIAQDEPSEVHDFSLREAPRLRHLEISRVYVDNMRIPLQNLTSIEARVVSADEMLELLKVAGRLLCAKFSDTLANEGIFPLPAMPLTHHCLKQLDLRPEHHHANLELHIFLRNIILPSLETFVYHAKDGIPVDELVSLFARSQSPIIEFEIVFPRNSVPHPLGTEKELVRLLESIPSTTNLSISLLTDQVREVVTDYFFGRFDGTSTFLPRLKVLNFAGGRGFDWSSVGSLLTNEKYRTINMRMYPDQMAPMFYFNEPGLAGLIRLAAKNPKTTLNIVDYRSGEDLTGWVTAAKSRKSNQGLA